MKKPRWERWVGLYPKPWRRRYGEELADLCRECAEAQEAVPRAFALDLARSALREHVRSLASTCRRRVAAVALLLGLALGLTVNFTERHGHLPALSPLIVRAVNGQGSSNHIAAAPVGARAGISSEQALRTVNWNARGARIEGISLAIFSQLYPRPGLLCWAVAIDRPGPHLAFGGPLWVPKDGARHATHAPPRVPTYNYDVVFINARTGVFLEETQGYSHLFGGPSTVPAR